ncbi:MAG: hypothetical protein ACREHE_10200 [Rhizomicrobium sp.]
MTGTSKVLRTKLALGFRSHSGWAAAILLDEDLRVVARRHVVLCDPGIDGAKQPFHHAEPMPPAKAEAYIARCAAATDRLARQAVASFKGRIVGACILTASGRPLPDLRSILASHALIHAAEGEFYRDALAGACTAAKLKINRLWEKDAPLWAASRFGEGVVKQTLAALGKTLGPPWTMDEKLATLGAWLTLAG